MGPVVCSPRRGSIAIGVAKNYPANPGESHTAVAMKKFIASQSAVTEQASATFA